MKKNIHILLPSDCIKRVLYLRLIYTHCGRVVIIKTMVFVYTTQQAVDGIRTKKKIKPEALTLKQDGNEVRRQMRCGNNSMMATTSSSFRISKSYIYIYIVTYQRMKHNADIGDMATFNINATSEFRSFALSRSL